MNGRLYDPFVQAPDLTQSMNRYSYCLNNPFLYVDFSGYTWLNNFGFNWGALSDCLRDFDWIEKKEIVLVTKNCQI